MAILDEIQAGIAQQAEGAGASVVGIGPVSYTHLTLPTKA